MTDQETLRKNTIIINKEGKISYLNAVAQNEDDLNETMNLLAEELFLDNFFINVEKLS